MGRLPFPASIANRRLQAPRRGGKGQRTGGERVRVSGSEGVTPPSGELERL